MRRLEAEVAVIGGGLGGVAAALAAADRGRSVVLTEETDRLGGQVTSQGVSALDEHPFIESFGGTRSYYRFRESVRASYRERYGAPSTMPDGVSPLNPGNGWVSRLCFEPAVGRRVIEAMLAEHVAAGRITVLLEHAPVSAALDGDRIARVNLRGPGGETVAVEAALYLDATELGDLLPLVGARYVTGAEARSDTGEPHARPDGPAPRETQAFTFGVAVEHRPGEDHTIPKPEGYEALRDAQPFTLTLDGDAGNPRRFRMFAEGTDGLPPFWTYRRLRDGALLDPSGATTDAALINWPSNDYRGSGILDVPPEEREEALAEAQRLSLSFLYWLQTEAERDDGSGRGCPELRPAPEVMETENGLSRYPYVRESRRLLARTRVVESDVVPGGDGAARARPFADSVGLGWYHLDLHACVGNGRTLYEPALPFQVPLGALVAPYPRNLLASAKNIGTTHLTSGAYRVHPVEWSVGEAAGAVAALCAEAGASPDDALSDVRLLRLAQRRLLARGAPVFWFPALPDGHPLSVPAQMLGVAGAVPEGAERWTTLEARPERSPSRAEAAAILDAAARTAGESGLRAVGSTGLAGDPAALARAGEVSAGLARLGVRARLDDPVTWGGLVGALAGPLDRWVGYGDGVEG